MTYNVFSGTLNPAESDGMRFMACRMSGACLHCSAVLLESRDVSRCFVDR